MTNKEIEKKWQVKEDNDGKYAACVKCGNELHLTSNPYTNRYSADCLNCDAETIELNENEWIELEKSVDI